MPTSYSFFGSLNGQDVFDISNADLTVSPDPRYTPPGSVAFWPIVVAIAAVVVSVWAILHSKDTTTITKKFDGDGKLIETDVTTTHDPDPFDIKVNGNTYTVTEYGIRYNANLPTQLIGYPSMEAYPAGQQITGYNLSSFQITSIQAL